MTDSVCSKPLQRERRRPRPGGGGVTRKREGETMVREEGEYPSHTMVQRLRERRGR